MAVAVFQVHGVFKVVEGVAIHFTLLRFHQLGGAAAAGGGDHFTAQALANGNGAAQFTQLVVFVHLVDHQAHGFIAVDEVVKHHPGSVAHLHLGPAGGIEEGETAIRALVRLQPCRWSRRAGPQHQSQNAANDHATQRLEELHQRGDQSTGHSAVVA